MGNRDVHTSPKKRLISPEAQRALKEAQERRKSEPNESVPLEIGGRREGKDPVRYGDWEMKGRAIDF